MNTHVLQLLPLWIGGDLSTREAEAVEAHLATCESCRAEAESYRLSQAWLEDAMVSPFGAEDREALRQAVMSREAVERKAFPVRWLGWGAAMLAAASILFLMSRSDPSAIPSLPAPRIATAEPPRPAPVFSTPTPVLRHRPRIRHLEQVQAAEPGSGPSRIEIQTTNPKIRIIWLARVSQAENASPSTKENS